MKKVYNCPATEVITVNATYGVCQAVSLFGDIYNGGGTETIDPEHGGL